MKLARSAIEKRLIGSFGRTMEAAPWSSCRLAGSWMGLAFFRGSRRRREIAIENVQRVFPDLSETAARRLARRSSQNFGMSFCEFLHLRTASAAEIREYCSWDGLEHILGSLTQGHGVMLTTAHFGAWEVMGARAVQEFPLTVVVRLTSNRALKSHIEDVRRAIGLDMILKSDSARASLGVLRANEGLAIFPDQHAGLDGASLPFLGHPTSVWTSPARLALSARAPIVPTFGVRRTPWLRDGRVVITAAPGMKLQRDQFATREEAVLEGTRFIIRETEAIIRKHPDQWLWMHRRWRPEDRAPHLETTGPQTETKEHEFDEQQ